MLRSFFAMNFYKKNVHNKYGLFKEWYIRIIRKL